MGGNVSWSTTLVQTNIYLNYWMDCNDPLTFDLVPPGHSFQLSSDTSKHLRSGLTTTLVQTFMV